MCASDLEPFYDEMVHFPMQHWTYYTECQINLPLSITGCTQPYMEICRFAAAAGAILTVDFIDREYN